MNDFSYELWSHKGETADMADLELESLARCFLGIFSRRRVGILDPIELRSLSILQAYTVQDLVIQARVSRGERGVGYKVGCTSRAIQQQFGLGEPICGRIMEPHVYFGNCVLNWNDFEACAVEPELAIRLRRDLPGDITVPGGVIDAIDFVAPAIEVHHYRFWFGQPTLQELIASNGLHACVVIGEQHTDPHDLNWVMEGVGLFLDGTLAASGIAAETLGSPLNSLCWLAEHLESRGWALRAGDWVIPGSPVRLVSVAAGQQVRADFTTLGSVSAVFAG